MGDIILTSREIPLGNSIYPRAGRCLCIITGFAVDSVCRLKLLIVNIDFRRCAVEKEKIHLTFPFVWMWRPVLQLVKSASVLTAIVLFATTTFGGDPPIGSADSSIQADSKSTQSTKSVDSTQSEKGKQQVEDNSAVATFGNGCFWCTEAVFQRVKGVQQVVSGFMGGHVRNPTYEDVLSKKSGHAEVLHIHFDPNVVSYEKLLEVFWKTHDPTSLNRQGYDEGPQYRSVVFYHSEEQQELAEKYKKLLDEAKAFDRPIVTEITKAGAFYPAEDYHQNYYNLNKNRNPYCRQIQIKLKKFREVFPDDIDPEKDRIK